MIWYVYTEGDDKSPPTSTHLCMESWGIPTSTVRIPNPAARMGPIVLPQPMSLRTAKL